MHIHVKLYSTLREVLPAENKGETTLQLPAQATLTDLLDQLGINRRVVISVNETHEADKTRSLQDGDFVRIFSSVSGGTRIKGDPHA